MIYHSKDNLKTIWPLYQQLPNLNHSYIFSSSHYSHNFSILSSSSSVCIFLSTSRLYRVTSSITDSINFRLFDLFQSQTFMAFSVKIGFHKCTSLFPSVNTDLSYLFYFSLSSVLHRYRFLVTICHS